MFFSPIGFQTHEDYRGLERAKEAMVDVAQFTNEVKRDSEHLVVIQKVRVSIFFKYIIELVFEIIWSENSSK